MASNDRHKLSEKHRRDGMGAFVQAGDVLRKGLNPGALLGCRLCTSAASPASPTSSESSTSSRSRGPSHPSTAPTGAPKAKKPKNNMLEEGLMWEFAWLLHVVPGQVPDHLDEIHRLAQQKARDKEFGMRNDWAKRKKWDADVRAEVLGQALRVMEAECERHGLSRGGARRDGGGQDGTAAAPERKRRRLESGDAAEETYKTAAVAVPTPPSSRGSPVPGSRGASEDHDEADDDDDDDDGDGDHDGRV